MFHMKVRNELQYTCKTYGGPVYWQIDGLVQERRNSIANALELRLSCTNLSIYLHYQASVYSGNGLASNWCQAILTYCEIILNVLL